jgi:hypothetical protein
MAESLASNIQGNDRRDRAVTEQAMLGNVC